MKAEQLKEYISKVVRTEVRNVIREEVRKCINEAFSGASAPQQKVVANEDVSVSYKSLMESQDEPVQQSNEKKKAVQYTKNSILNQVLNETAQGFKPIPQEGSMVSMMGGFGGGGTDVINESVAPEVPATAPVEVKKTAAVFNRDFRALMKAVDKKVSAKKGVV